MGFRINRGIFQKLEADGKTYTNAFKVGEDGRLKEVDADGNPVGDYLKVGEKASDADFLDGLDSSSFITTSGGTVSGSLNIASTADNNRYQKDGSWVNPKDPWSNFHIKAGHGQMYMDASVYHIRPQNGSTDWLYINSANINVNLDRLNVKRHIDANTGWAGGSAEMFLGWYSDKIIIGNDNYGMHDLARDMPLNSISLNNPLYSWKNIALGKNASMPTAEWGATGNSTGFVVIEFPVNSYAMIHAEIAVYEYNSNNASTVLVGGHPWNGKWYQFGSKTLGVLNKQVRFGRINATGVYCIILGDAGSPWTYGQVQLKRIQNGNYYDNRVVGNGSYRIYQSQDETIFSYISEDTSDGIDVNRAANADYASNANLLDNINSTQFLRSDANDTFTNLTGTSITIGEAVIGQHAVHSGYYGMWNTEASTGTTEQYLIISKGTDTYINGDNVYIRAGNNSTSNQVNVTTSGTYIGGNKVWHAGNDGSGSGLDADTVDGYEAARFFRIDGSTADSRGPDFDALMPSSNQTYFKEVHAINEGANIPSGAYTYGVVQSTYMSSMKLQWYVPHTASRGNSYTQDTIYFRTNWGGGTWYGWKYLIHSGNIAGQSVNYANSAGAVAWANVTGKPSTFAPSAHNHDSLYDGLGSAGAVNDRIDADILPAIAQNATDIGRNATEINTKLSTTGKAADSELIDGIDSSRLVYGANSRRSTRYDGEGIVSPNQNSGFYYGYNPDGAPFNEWWNWVTIAGASWVSGNNYDFKLAHNFHGDDFYVSRMTNGSQGSWRKIIDSGNIGSYALTSLPDHDHSTLYAGHGFINSGDWNTYGSPHSGDGTFGGGIYRVESSAANPPASGVYNWSLYQQGNASRGSQIAVGAYAGGNRLYFRGSNQSAGVYRSWAEVWHTDNFDPSTKESAGAAQALRDDLDPRITTNETNIARNATDIATKANSSGSYNQDFYVDDLYYDSWIRNHTNTNGIYWNTTGWHLYPQDNDDFLVRSGNSGSAALRFNTGGTSRNYVYCSSSNEIGFLTSARAWALRVDNNKNTQIYNNLTVNGAVTATSFAGDGAALTNLPVQSIPVFEEGNDTELSIIRIDFSPGQGAAIVTLSNNSTYRLGFAR